jgi:VanZ family protein
MPFLKKILRAANAYLPPAGIYAAIFWLSSRPVADLPFSPPDFLSHFTAYTALSFFSARAVGRTLSGKRLGLLMVVLFLLAALDEFHQYWVPTRFWSAWDLIYDAAGILAGVAAHRGWVRLKGESDAGQGDETTQVF